MHKCYTCYTQRGRADRNRVNRTAALHCASQKCLFSSTCREQWERKFLGDYRWGILSWRVRKPSVLLNSTGTATVAFPWCAWRQGIIKGAFWCYFCELTVVINSANVVRAACLQNIFPELDVIRAQFDYQNPYCRELLVHLSYRIRSQRDVERFLCAHSLWKIGLLWRGGFFSRAAMHCMELLSYIDALPPTIILVIFIWG